LIDTYGFTPVRAARVLAAVQGAINDGLVVTWFYKYLYDQARPNQYNQQLRTYICTPLFPTYPSGHSVVAGVAEAVLSYFFAPEADRLHQLAEEASISRLYGGVHFPPDLSEGLRLGRQIGRIIVNTLSSQRDRNQVMVDIPITKDLHANLPPPPYTQVIPFPSRVRACNLPLLPCNAKHYHNRKHYRNGITIERKYERLKCRDSHTYVPDIVLFQKVVLRIKHPLINLFFMEPTWPSSVLTS
jgi:hypothetical protein